MEEGGGGERANGRQILLFGSWKREGGFATHSRKRISRKKAQALLQKNHNISPFKPKLKLVSRYTIFSGLDKTSYKASAPPFVFFPRKENLSCPQSDHPYPYPKRAAHSPPTISPQKRDFPPHHNSSRIVTHWKKKRGKETCAMISPNVFCPPHQKRGIETSILFFSRHLLRFPI